MRELGGAVERVASVPPVSADLPSTPHDDLDSPDASFGNFENLDFSRFLHGVSNLVLVRTQEGWSLYARHFTDTDLMIDLMGPR